MSTYDLEEQERISALKDWWDKWGNWVTAGVVATLVGVVGVQLYRYYQKSQSLQAETLFKSVKKTGEEVAAGKDAANKEGVKDSKKLSDAVSALVDKFPGTFQATEAQLMAAKAAFEAGDFASAKTQLQWVIDNGRDTHRTLARVRLAAVMLETKDYDGALKTLEGAKDEAFQSVTADLKGDIYAAQGKRAEARASYQIAVEKADARSSLKAISQAKLDAFGGTDESKKVAIKDDAKSGEKNAKDGKDSKGITK